MSEKEKAIQKFMSSLEISKEEAEQLWQDDQEDFIGEEGEQMTAKAKKNRRYEKSDAPRKKSTRERKVDENKKVLLEILINAIKNEGIPIDSVKNEAEFSFMSGADSYSVKLIKHRVKKG